MAERLTIKGEWVVYKGNLPGCPASITQSDARRGIAQSPQSVQDHKIFQKFPIFYKGWNFLCEWPQAASLDCLFRLCWLC